MAIDNRKKDIDINKELEEINGLDPNAPDPDKDDDVETPGDEEGEEVPDGSEDPQLPSDPPADPTPTPDPAPAPAPAKPQPTVEERYKESAREAMILTSRNRKFSQAVDEAENIPEPTEDELKAAYPAWDTMDDTMRMLAKDNLMNKMKFSKVHQVVAETKAVEEWADKVDKYVLESNNPEIEGREEEFKKFCMKPTRRGVDFEDLAAAFSHTATPAPHRGSLLETGSGGPKGQDKPKEHTAEEMRTLRTKSPKLYKQLLMAGKFDHLGI